MAQCLGSLHSCRWPRNSSWFPSLDQLSSTGLSHCGYLESEPPDGRPSLTISPSLCNSYPVLFLKYVVEPYLMHLLQRWGRTHEEQSRVRIHTFCCYQGKVLRLWTSLHKPGPLMGLSCSSSGVFQILLEQSSSPEKFHVLTRLFFILSPCIQLELVFCWGDALQLSWANNAGYSSWTTTWLWPQHRTSQPGRSPGNFPHLGLKPEAREASTLQSIVVTAASPQQVFLEHE